VARPEQSVGPTSGGLNPRSMSATQEEIAAGIGLRFVKSYYDVLCSTPNKMHHFYCDTSTYTYAVGSQDPATVMGTEAIFSKIAELGFDDVRVDFESGSIDTQPSGTDGNIMVMVTGTFSMKGLPPKPFVQTMLLSRRPTGFYVVNDVCRVLVKKALLASCDAKVHGRNRDSAEACSGFMEDSGSDTLASAVTAAEPQAEETASTEAAADEEDSSAVPVEEEAKTPAEPEKECEAQAPSAPTPAPVIEAAAPDTDTADDTTVSAAAEEPVAAAVAAVAAAVETPPQVEEKTAEVAPSTSTAPAPVTKPAAAAVVVVSAPEPVVPKKPTSFLEAARMAQNQPTASRAAPKRAPPAKVGDKAKATERSASIAADAPTKSAQAPAAATRSNERKQSRRTEGVSVFVRNISEATGKEEVRGIYERFGSISTVHLKGERGYGFFEYADATSVQKALAAQTDGTLRSPFTIEERRASGRGRGTGRFAPRHHDDERREGARRGGRRGNGGGARGRGRIAGRGR